MTLLITVILCMTVALCIWRRKYRYLFCALYGILPAYYALDLGQGIPLLTAGRMMFLLIILLSLIYIWKNRIKVKYNILWQDKFLLLYFAFRLIPNLYYIFDLSEAVNVIFKITIEQICLVMIFKAIFREKQEIENSIKWIVYVAAGVFAFGIAESFTNRNMADFLYVVNRDILHDAYIRLGVLRSEFTFGIPNFFSMFCVLTTPFILFFYDKERKIRYLLILMLDVFAIIYSASRACIMLLILFLFMYMLFNYKNHLVTPMIGILVVSIGIIVILVLTSEKMRYFYLGSLQSILNSLGIDVDFALKVPEGVVGYGSNSTKAVYSRLFQLSGIEWIIKNNILFGLGAAAQNRGAMQYLYLGKWSIIKTYDIGYVAMFGDEGICGLAGYSTLFYGLLHKIMRRKNRNCLNNYFIMFYILYLICLLFTDVLSNFFWIVTALCLSYNQIIDNQEGN